MGWCWGVVLGGLVVVSPESSAIATNMADKVPTTNEEPGGFDPIKKYHAMVTNLLNQPLVSYSKPYLVTHPQKIVYRLVFHIQMTKIDSEPVNGGSKPGHRRTPSQGVCFSFFLLLGNRQSVRSDREPSTFFFPLEPADS